MYYIVNKRKWQSYGHAFSDFESAFWIQQLKMPDAHIEYFNGMDREIVWDPSWEERDGW